MEVERILECVRNCGKTPKNRKRFAIAVLLLVAATILIWPFVFPIHVTGSRLPYEYTIHGTYVEINKYTGSEEEVVIPGIIWFRPVAKIGEKAFEKQKIRSVYLPDSVKELGYRSFGLCSNLEEVHLSGRLKSIAGAAFIWCEALQRIEIPEGVEEIRGNAFKGCENLETVILPDTLKIIRGFVFEDCGKLEYIEIPGEVEEICRSAFEGTGWKAGFGDGFILAGKNVLIHYSGEEETVEVPEGVEYIGYSLFWKCTNMKQLVLPASLKRCNQDLFISCDNLEYVVFKNSDIEFQEDSFTRYIGPNVTIIGKKGSVVEAYAERMGCSFQNIESWGG